jgi:diguanylate cyclase (GGDEF)-like protein/PAS domain S-box-containing protein
MERTMSPFKRQIPLALVVDDDDTMRTMIREVLEQIGLVVEEAEDGATGLDRFHALRPNIVLLDVKMPFVDGFSFCRQVRSEPDGKHVPILMMTATEDTASIERAYDVGATDFIRKPIHWSILGHRVKYVLRTANALNSLARSEAQLANAQRLARMGSWDWYAGQNELFLTAAACRILPHSPGAVTSGRDGLIQLFHADDHQIIEQAIQETLQTGKPTDIECRVPLPNGEERIVQQRVEVLDGEGGDAPHLHGVLQDITERRRAEAQVLELVSYDAITGLPNRLFFLQQLGREVAEAERLGHSIAVLQINLDRFKRINDTLGRSAGDAVLKEVARRLRTCLRPGNQLLREGHTITGGDAARLGSDEFLVIARSLGHIDDAAKVSRRIRSELSRPMDIGDHEFVMTASIGIAIYPLDGTDVDTLIRNADTATSYAKQKGCDTSQFFTESINRAAVETLVLEADLRKALELDQLAVYYQPKVDLATRKIIGVEALARWFHPELGLVSPVRFIPLAEEAGLIVPIGNWVLNTAMRQVAEWHALGHRSISVAVNMSAQNFGHASLTETIRGAIASSGLRAQFLEIEVTESMLMRDINQTVQILQWMRDQGIRISVDDFGTGYSSLAYLRRFPLDVLKIDRSFVQESTQNADGAAITRAIIALARSLNLEVVAEGVETVDQAMFLQEHGCRFAQGFLYGRPVPAADLLAMLNNARNARRPSAADTPLIATPGIFGPVVAEG